MRVRWSHAGGTLSMRSQGSAGALNANAGFGLRLVC